MKCSTVSPAKACVLCGRPLGDAKIINGQVWADGNKPYPLVDDEISQCCHECDRTKVMPARMHLIVESAKSKSKS